MEQMDEIFKIRDETSCKKIWIRDDLVEMIRDETSWKKSAIPYMRKCVYFFIQLICTLSVPGLTL